MRGREFSTAGLATDAGGRDDRYGSVLDIASHALFLLLLALQVARTLRHEMWRDELETFQIGRASASLAELFGHLRYEAHGPLWEMLVWLVTRVTADPQGMQMLHAALAAVLWIIIYRWSPFSRVEKFLLLLGYFLFFEYVVISRSYALAAVLGLGFVAIRSLAPQRVILAWLLLGLLANIVVHATIWSLAMAAVFVFERRPRDTAFYGGAAIYLGCLAFGIATMMPAADFGPWGSDIRFTPLRLGHALMVPLGAFVPIDPTWIGDAIRFLRGATDVIPNFWNPNPLLAVVAFTQGIPGFPLLLALVFALPLLLSWLIVRRPLGMLEFAISYAGIVAFATLWDFAGNARHHGIVFMALVATAWSARTQSAGDGWSRWMLRAVLLVSAIAGMMTLAAELRPFSQGRGASQWLRQNNLAGGFLIGSRDGQVSSVAGYLGRPIYYLECQCLGTFIVWNQQRQSPLSPEQFRTRLARALDLAGRSAILIRNVPLSPDQLVAELSGLEVTLLQSFTGAEIDENYWIYRVSRP